MLIYKKCGLRIMGQHGNMSFAGSESRTIGVRTLKIKKKEEENKWKNGRRGERYKGGKENDTGRE
jgi:hypothetical protein